MDYEKFEEAEKVVIQLRQLREEVRNAQKVIKEGYKFGLTISCGSDKVSIKNDKVRSTVLEKLVSEYEKEMDRLTKELRDI